MRRDREGSLRPLDTLTEILLIIGGLNWGLIGFFDFNLVAAIFGTSTTGIIISRIIYALVGLSALYLLAAWRAVHVRWCRLHPVTTVTGRTI